MVLFLFFSGHSMTHNVEANHTQPFVIPKQPLFCNQNAYQSRKHFLNVSLPPSLFFAPLLCKPRGPCSYILTAVFILFGHYRFISVGWTWVQRVHCALLTLIPYLSVSQNFNSHSPK